MLLRRRSGDSVRVGDWVVAVEAIGDIPEGTRGRIKLIDGFGWVRYWVAWETGEWTGSVDAASVVRADRLEQWRADREAAAARATTSARPGAAVAGGDSDGGGDGGGAAGGGGAGGGGVPEHLLERARQARARKAAAAG
ncbi:MAG TPA: hypothetical protein VFA84_15665 [Acidimicrobiales bacterium]|nr:hypothetical protein [Acidimicrobiales bacterium]